MEKVTLEMQSGRVHELTFFSRPDKDDFIKLVLQQRGNQWIAVDKSDQVPFLLNIDLVERVIPE